MPDLDAGYDVRDISTLVTAVIAESPLLPGATLTGFTNGKCFFFTDVQIGEIAGSVSAGQLRRRDGGGWEEVVPGAGLRFLAERHINGGTYYRLRNHWQFVVTAG